MQRKETPREEEDRGESQVNYSNRSLPDAPDVPQQLRRRRAAAERLPVLACGCGDPWHAEPLVPSQANLAAARRAWSHLRDLDLLDADGYLTAILAGEAS